MQRMGALDSYLYYGDVPDAMTHTVKFGILDPSTQPGGCSLACLRDAMGRLLPDFRCTRSGSGSGLYPRPPATRAV